MFSIPPRGMSWVMQKLKNMDRFWNKVVKGLEDECWIWKGAYRGLYGAIKYEGKVIGAHVLSYILANGTYEKQYFVCHKCDNPKCVNPNHLFLGTHSDNMKDAFKKGRIKVPEGKRFNSDSKLYKHHLSDKEANKVKNIIKNRKDKSLKAIAFDLNIPYQTIRDISCGRTY
jgi:hypothetical protein